MMSDPLPWLRDAEEPWVRHGVLAIDRPDDAGALEAARRETLADPRVRELIDEVADHEWAPMTNHKQAKHPLHKAALLVELGLRGSDPAGQILAERLLAHPADEGPLQIATRIPERFGGSGETSWGWMGCDAPLVIQILAGLGHSRDGRVQRAAAHLASLALEQGWPCSGSIAGFRGPGRKADPCPYATLISTRALLVIPEHASGEACRRGAEMLLTHWENRAGRKLYLFGIGTDYQRPKYPTVWYDLLHVLEVLSRCPWTHGDPRFGDLLVRLLEQIDGDGRLVPGSVWMTFKGFDFAQKRAPSPTLTLAAERIQRRIGG